MSMRISSVGSVAIGALLLAACGSQHGNADVAVQQRADPDAGDRIACAHGTAALADDCTVERTAGDSGLILTLRHPDGAFRRLLVTRDGRGVVAADGAQSARVTIVDKDMIDVALGGDRYRLPATVGTPAS